jgi:integrase/recombinase XerD
MKVKLKRRKQSKKGNISLYLEIYKGSYVNSEGKRILDRDYEYLNLYLIDKPKTNVDKDYNKQVEKLANGIRAKRELDIQNGIYDFSSRNKFNANFIDFVSSLLESKKSSKGNYGSWDSTLKHLKAFAGDFIAFKNIDLKFCEGFKHYLINKVKKSSGEPLSSASTSSYFSKFRAALNRAVKEKIISFNPALDVSIPRITHKPTVYLDLDELKLITKAECRYEYLKRAFLFSCYTGLRWSDVQKLKWGYIQKLPDNTLTMSFNQQKTKKMQILHIPNQAVKLMGEKGGDDELIFKGLKYSSYMNLEISRWMLNAGITKKVTFHTSRHTYGVLQLTYGQDIYTLSKLMGHSHLKTTEIYAKIIDSKMKDAANVIPSLD